MGDTVIVTEGDPSPDGGADAQVAMAAAAATVEAEHAAEEAEEAAETAEAAEAIAEAALGVALAGEGPHEHDEYVRMEDLRAMADLYVLELAALTETAEESEAGADEGEVEEDVAPPSIEKPKKKTFRERWDGS